MILVKLFYNVSPIEIAALETVDQHFGGSDIGSDGDIMHIAEPEKVHIIRLMGLGVQRISEEDEHIDLVAGDTSGHLLVSALRAA